MDKITAEKNFNLINKHPKGNFYVNKNEKIIEISKWNLIGRIIKHYNNRNGNVRNRVNDVIIETLKVVNKEPLQKKALLSKIAKSRGISLQILDEKVQNATTSQNIKPPEVQAPIIMPKVGFANGGNTCYIAASMQVLRNIPAVREYLNKKAPLEKRFPTVETDEMLKLRQQIKDYIGKLFHSIDQGRTVTGHDIKELEKMYATLRGGNHIKVGGGHDPYEFFRAVVLSILDIPSENDSLSFDLIGFKGTVNEAEAIKIAEQTLEHCLSANDGLPPKILTGFRELNTATVFTLQDTIALKASDGKTYTYRLVGAVRNSAFHAVAYLRDHQNKQWVVCNDAKVDRVESLHESLSPNLRHVYYALVE